MRTFRSALLVAGILLGTVGCVKAPERIEVNVGSDRPPPVDVSRVPEPATLEEARAELVKAYQNIEHLQRDNARLTEKAAKYKSERDDCRRRLKKYQGD
jgi:hypothetical protein